VRTVVSHCICHIYSTKHRNGADNVTSKKEKNTTEVKATYTDWNEQMMQKAQKPTASGQSTMNFKMNFKDTNNLLEK